MNHTCTTIYEDLKAYRDQELPLLRRLVVGLHVSRCEVCTREMVAMEKITQEMLAADEARLAPELRQKILHNLPPQAASATPPRPVQRQKFAFEYGALAAVLVVVMLTFTLRGQKISNTFNAANNGLADSTGGSAPEVDNSATALAAPKEHGAWQSSDGHIDRSAGIPTASKSVGAPPLAAVPDGLDGSPLLPPPVRRVHKEGHISVQVLKLEEQSEAAEQIVKSASGFVASNSLNTSTEGQKVASLEVRVPVQQFETVLNKIAALGTVKSKQISGEDVTDKVSDAEQANHVYAQDLWTKQEQLRQAEQRAAHARHEPDLWGQRQEVRNLRIQLAQIRARVFLLTKLSDMSNLSIQLEEKPKSAAQGGFVEELNDTGHSAYESFLLAARVPLNALMWLVALSPIWLPLFLLYRLALRYFDNLPKRS